MSDDTQSSGDDLYRTLGVPFGASEDEITRAYRRRAREEHPDANPDASGVAFSGLTDAYEVLRDPVSRRSYDRTRRARTNAVGAAAGTRIPVHHLSTQPAANRASTSGRPSQATSVDEVELALTFDQAALGTRAVMPVQSDRPCPMCYGTGRGSAADTTCADCDGAGFIVRKSGGINVRTGCTRCDGAGQLPAEACTRCGGSGRELVSSEVVVRVPAGVDNGVRLRVPLPGGAAHVLAVVRVAGHPYFGRRGNDLTLQVPVTIAEASLGSVITIPTLAGAVAIRLPAGTPHGRKMRVRGRGIPHAGGPGDLLITIEIVIPTALNDNQRAALEAFAAATDSPRSHFETPTDSA